LKHIPLLLALALASVAAQAQTPTAKPAAPAASAAAPVSAAKKALIDKILHLQQPAIEALARQLAEQPAVQMLQRAGAALQRLPVEQREAVAKEIQSDARKYADEATPIVRDRAIKLAPSTIGTVLAQNFNEDELKQIIAILESPVNRKFQSLGGEMQRSLGERLVAETRASVEPKVQALEQSVIRRINAASAPASAPAAASAAKK
jgi:hypothetical protein